MRIGIYPGSFDPVTYGHVDIITRACRLVDHLVIGVLENKAKTPLFSVDNRVNMLKDVTKDLDNVSIRSFQGLTVDFAKEQGADVIIRGLRAITDFEYELQMAQTNHKLAPGIETVFLATELDYAYLSSTIVREVASFGGDISKFVPPEVEQAFRNRKTEKR